MHERICGIETEFGCLVHDPKLGSSEAVVDTVKEYAFTEKKLGLIDLHARDYAFEPARGGGFLVNGGRLYVDAVGDHEEYASPECSGLFDLITWDKAGQRILQDILNELGLAEQVTFHNNSVDHFGGHTFGCHENYLVDLDADHFQNSLGYLLPFLVTRQIYAGVGRVNGHRLNHTSLRDNVMEIGDHVADTLWVSHIYGVEIDDSVDFQLSQRADHIVRTIASRVRFNRAIINPKWETFYAFNHLHRLHVLFGESNMMEYAAALKVGTTRIALELVEEGWVGNEVLLANPLEALKGVSRDPSWRWLVKKADGSTIPAVDLQRLYLDRAKKRISGRDDETDWVLREWEATLDALERDPWELEDRLDWVAKRRLMESYVEAEGVAWNDEVLQSLDLEYHNIDPERGLYYGLQEIGAVRRVTTDEAIRRATHHAPDNTRAGARARVIQSLIKNGTRRYVIDWDGVYVGKHAPNSTHNIAFVLDRDKGGGKNHHLELRDPFKTYDREVKQFVEDL
jgi:proteasome accessory factor A